MKSVMSNIRGASPLRFYRLARTELGSLAALNFDPAEIERFLGPIADIQDAIRRGPAHVSIAIEAGGAMVGFYVVHPDPRDGSCWWVGWLALDRSQQGRGYGRCALVDALGHLQRVPGCRRVRLLVAPENTRARRLYDAAGFDAVGRFTVTGELILELALRPSFDAAARIAFAPAIAASGARRVFNHRRLRRTAGPHAAWVIGVERGPPQMRACA